MSSTSVSCKFGKACSKFPNCEFYQSPENTPDCPFMTSSKGCTNLHCKYRHPPGFVHACIWGINCTNNSCPYVHPSGKLCEQHPKPKNMNLGSCKTSECDSRHTTLCKYGDDCKHKDTCPFTHPENTKGKNTNVECPFMNTPKGCTNWNCTYWHPKDFVHACAYGMQCRKRAAGKCHFLHPDERGFYFPVEQSQPALVPRREAPPPPRDVPSPSKKTHLEKDEYGHSLVYNNKGEIIGIIDNRRFISFTPDIPLEVQEADRAWDAEMNDYDPSEDELETDPEAYSDHSEPSENPDDDCDWNKWETDPEVYGFPAE